MENVFLPILQACLTLSESWTIPEYLTGPFQTVLTLLDHFLAILDFFLSVPGRLRSFPEQFGQNPDHLDHFLAILDQFSDHFGPFLDNIPAFPAHFLTLFIRSDII